MSRMPPLRSTSLASADYDPSTLELLITFSNGRSYSYSEVPKEVYDGLLGASSPGAYYHANIKDNYG